MPPRQTGSGKGIAIALLSIVLAVSLLVNLVLLIVTAVSSGSSRGQSTKSVLTSGNRAETVAVIPVWGLLLDDVESRFREDLDMAAADGNVRAVLIHLDSPGGTVPDSHQMYEALRRFRADTGKPVVVHMDSVAASGGYFLACAADEIVAEPSTITGSIGVLISFPQLSGFAEKTGIRFHTIVADDSPYKNMLDMWEIPSAEGLADIQSILNQQHELFSSVVEAGRGSQLASSGTSLGDVTNGKVWLGPEAQRMGLVDQVGLFDDAVARAAALAGLTRPHVVRYDREPTLAEALGLAGAPGGELKLNMRTGDGGDLKQAVAELLHEVSSPRSLYLYRGVQ